VIMTPARPSFPLARMARLGAVAALVLALTGCASGGGHPLAQASGPDQLRVAHLRYDRHEYTETVDLVKGYLQYQSGAGDLDDAHFLLGMCYVQQKDWPLAATEFAELTSNFADSPRTPDAQYWLAVAYWRQAHGAPYDQEMTQRTIAQCERFLALYPTHPKVAEVDAIKKDGRNRLAEKAVRNGRLYLKLSQFGPARYYFEKVEKDGTMTASTQLWQLEFDALSMIHAARTPRPTTMPPIHSRTRCLPPPTRPIGAASPPWVSVNPSINVEADTPEKETTLSRY